MKKLLIILCLLLSCIISFRCANNQTSSYGRQKSPFTYKTEYQEPTSTLYFCACLHIIFNTIKPSSDEAERILREVLESFMKNKPNNDILATAWFTPTGSEIDEDMIPLLDGSDHLLYDSKTKKIVTWNQHEGIKTEITKGTEFVVEYEEYSMVVKPYTKFASLKVIFPTKPNKTEDEIYRILIEELKKAVLRQNPKLKTIAAPYIGDPKNPAGQKQMQHSNGKYFIIEYNPLSGNIKELVKDKVLDSIK